MIIEQIIFNPCHTNIGRRIIMPQRCLSRYLAFAHGLRAFILSTQWSAHTVLSDQCCHCTFNRCVEKKNWQQQHLFPSSFIALNVNDRLKRHSKRISSKCIGFNVKDIFSVVATSLLSHFHVYTWVKANVSHVFRCICSFRYEINNTYLNKFISIAVNINCKLFFSLGFIILLALIKEK